VTLNRSAAYDDALSELTARLDGATVDRWIGLLREAKGSDLTIERRQIAITATRACANFAAHIRCPNPPDGRSSRIRIYRDAIANAEKLRELLREPERLTELSVVVLSKRGRPGNDAPGRSPILEAFQEKIRELNELQRWFSDALAEATAPGAHIPPAWPGMPLFTIDEPTAPPSGPPRQSGFRIFILDLRRLYERATGKPATSGIGMRDDQEDVETIRTSPFIAFAQSVHDWAWPGARPKIGESVHKVLREERGPKPVGDGI
jgi:hypothetical protein